MSADGSLTAGAVAALTGGELIGAPEVRIAGVAALDAAGPGDLAFLADARWLSRLVATRAGALLLPPRWRDQPGGPPTRIVVADPRAAARQVAVRLGGPPVAWGIAPSAQLGSGVRWRGRLAVGPGAIIGAGAVLGADCVVAAGAFLGDGVVLGDRCVVGAGARIGIAGFGHAGSPAGPVDLPPSGTVRIGDDVTLGAGTTIARGSFGQSTVIASGTKLDAQVHVGHNAAIGARCVLMAQVGIAGSVTLGDGVIVAGQAGLADGLTVGSGARIAAQAGVIGDVPAGATVSGYPARDHRQVLRQAAALARLSSHARRLERLGADGHGAP